MTPPMLPDPKTSHLTLDPADWDEFRAIAHRMVDDSLEFVRTIRDRAPWQQIGRAHV